MTEAPELALISRQYSARGADSMPKWISHSVREGFLLPDIVERYPDTSAILPPSLAVVFEYDQSSPVASSPARRQAGNEASPISNLSNGNRGGAVLARG